MQSGHVCLRSGDYKPYMDGLSWRTSVALGLRLAGVILFVNLFSGGAALGANISGVWANEGGDNHHSGKRQDREANLFRAHPRAGHSGND